jgi:mono/diheme cytochrome c family protein
MLRASLRSLFLCAALALSARAAVDFNRDVRHILSEKCFACHGPDGSKRKAELRLDIAENAYAPAKSGEKAIVPGKPEESELLKRISSADADDVMPPPKEHKKLTTPEVETLRQWIAEGGRYDKHWAFKRVTAPQTPPGNPIDALVRARLEGSGLTPSPEEDRARLLRRVTLDLTGLPPTPREVDAFFADNSPEAYDHVVDRLLASPHFGERIAIPWLDLARFSDTGGYHNDSTRDVWMYRDWVVNAFNSNKPFDQFTIEQLAGDLLPNATADQKIASCFMRNVMTSDEGGIIEAEYLNLYIVDRVSTFGATWLGLTVNCAQCHDHKYDPITSRDYYGLYAFFHNVPEKGKDGVRDRSPEPRMMVPTEEQAKEFARLDAEIAAADKAVKDLAPKLDADQVEWEKTIVASGRAGEPKGPWAKFLLDADGSGTTDTAEAIAGKIEGEGTFVEGSVGNSYRVVATGHIDYGERFGFEKDQPFAVAAWLRLKPQGGAPFGKMENGPDFRGWDVEIQGNRAHFHLIHKWPNEAIHVQAEKDLPFDTFSHVAVTYDGSGKAAGVAMYVNGQPVKVSVLKDNLTGSIETKAPFAIGRRGGGTSPFTGRVDDLRIYSRALDKSEAAQLGGAATFALVAIPAEQRTPEQREQLKKFYRENFAAEYSATEKRVTDARNAKAEIEKQVPNVMVMAEMEKPRDTFIKIRGSYDKNGDKVTAAAPAFSRRSRRSRSTDNATPASISRSGSSHQRIR